MLYIIYTVVDSKSAQQCAFRNKMAAASLKVSYVCQEGKDKFLNLKIYA